MKQTAYILSALAALMLCSYAARSGELDGVAQEERVVNGIKQTRLVTGTDAAAPMPVSALGFWVAGSDGLDDFIGQLLWQTGDPTGMCNDCAVSPDGFYLGLGISLNNQRAELYQSGSSTPLWQFPVGDGNTKVALSQNCEVFAFSYEHYLSIFDNTSAVPIWTYDYGLSAYAGPVAVTRDGSLIIATSIMGTEGHIIAFSPTSATPLWSATVTQPSGFGWYGLRICADGSRISANGKFNVWILDATDGAILWTAVTNNTEEPVPLSADGSVIAIGSLNNGSLRVLAWNSTDAEYQEIWHYTFPGGSSRWCSSVAVSADGRTVAAGSLVFLSGGYDGNLAVFETWGSGQPLWLSSTFGDMVGSIAISDNGLTIAAGSWGDLDNLLTDLRVFEKYTSTPFYALSSPGSINSVDMSADGTMIFAGGKHVHNRMFGNGGDAYAVSADLGGGTVQGRVTVSGGASPEDVLVEVLNANRRAYTQPDGRYAIPSVPAGTHTVRASKPGVSIGTQPGVVVPEGGSVSVNFNLTTVTGEPQNLTATSGQLTAIPLAWSLTDLHDRWHEFRIAVGDEEPLRPPEQSPQLALNGFISWYTPNEVDDADSIWVYRSLLPGGPYIYLATVSGAATAYVDSYNLFPTYTYYYVVSAFYPQGQSAYSNEAFASLDDSYLNYNPSIPAMTAAVNFDGVLSPGEWSDAVSIDISDVFGYDQPNTPGSVYLYMKYDDSENLLLVACEDHVNTALADNEGVGFYVDDNDDDVWTYSAAGTEGNYWIYWHPSGADLRYRSLTGGPYASAPYYTFPNPSIGFSSAAGYVTCEFAIPMGFRNVYDMALYGPDKSPGIGAFSISRDGSGNAIFNGWWPQNMASIVSNPDQFADCPCPATLFVPPAAVNDLVVERQGSDALHLTWTDPDSGVDNLPLASFVGLELWHNGQLLTILNPGVETYLDADVTPYGWYEYALRGWVNDPQGQLYGPMSGYVGEYVTADPQITEISYDDGSWESMWIVSQTFEDNQFAVRFTPESYPVAIWTISLMTNTADSIQLAVAADDFGTPGQVVAGPYLYIPSGNFQFSTFHIPGLEQPAINSGDFWIKVLWLPSNPGEPAICMDESSSDNRSWWYNTTNGWVQFVYPGDLMIRAGVALPPVGVEAGENQQPFAYYLAQNSPNPFNPTTEIRYGLKKSGQTRITVYDLQGREVASLANGWREAGEHQITFEGAGMPSGIYFAKLTAGDFTAVQKMVLMK